MYRADFEVSQDSSVMSLLNGLGISP